MKKIILLIIAVLIISSALILSIDTNENTNNQMVDGLNSTSNITQAITDAKNENKKILLIFDQDSCYYCDLFKEDTLSNSEVQEILNNEYVVVDIDINKEESIASKYKIFGTPSTIFLNKNNKEIRRIEGYVSANEFLDTLKEI